METAIPTLSTIEIIIFCLVVITLAILCIWMIIRIFKDSEPVSIAPAMFPHTISPSHRDMDMIECSVNIIAIDKEGGMFIGFYDYDNLGWVFMHDMFNPHGDFVWMYRPSSFKVT